MKTERRAGATARLGSRHGKRGYSPVLPQNGRRVLAPGPPLSKAMKQKKTVRFRTDSTHVAKWTRAALGRKQDLSSFARDAMDAAAIELVTGEDLDRRLVALRSTVHAAQHVRTDDQRQFRLARVLAHIQAMLAREVLADDD